MRFRNIIPMNLTHSPLVTVIIPNYNHALYLPQRIESVLNQTVRNIEIIILDDCSPDNSRAIIKQYANQDSRIRVLFNEQNSGSTFKQWNKGFTLARGQYIWIAESDDYAEPSFLAQLLLPLQADEQVVLAYCHSLDVDGEAIGNRWQKFLTNLDPMWQYSFVTEGLPLVKRFLAFRNFIPNASAVLFRASSWHAVGPADEGYRLMGDVLFWARLLARGKLAFIVQPLNYFRTHHSNARRKNYEDGTAVEEATRIPLLLRSYGELDPAAVEEAVRLLLDVWYHASIYHSIPWKRQQQIYRNFVAIDPSNSKRILRTFSHKFLAGASGLRILLGDRLLYPLLRKLKKPLAT